jgi:hypothetical protein
VNRLRHDAVLRPHVCRRHRKKHNCKNDSFHFHK